MSNIPVNIDMHILATAEFFPNLLGPLMINDYIQGLQASRKSDAKHWNNSVTKQLIDASQSLISNGFSAP